jgi:hypothetical protein
MLDFDRLYDTISHSTPLKWATTALPTLAAIAPDAQRIARKQGLQELGGCFISWKAGLQSQTPEMRRVGPLTPRTRLNTLGFLSFRFRGAHE